jgi:hypothetical protein
MAVLGALGYGGYKLFRRSQEDRNGVAYARGEPKGVRNAGADATASRDRMSKQDEALDETFPASDATAKY